MEGIIKVDYKEFGVLENKAKEIEAAFMPYVINMEILEPLKNKLLDEVGDEKPTENQKAFARNLRLDYVKARTGTSNTHKDQKAVFLKAGKFVDSLKNSQAKASIERESELAKIEQYDIILEKKRLDNLRELRYQEIKNYLDSNELTIDYALMSESVWKNFLSGTKLAFKEKQIEVDKVAEEIQDKTEENEILRKQNIELTEKIDEKNIYEVNVLLKDKEFEIKIISDKKVTNVLGLVTFINDKYIIRITKVLK